MTHFDKSTLDDLTLQKTIGKGLWQQSEGILPCLGAAW